MQPEKDTTPIVKKKDVQQSNDEHIDQDFPGFPHAPAKENLINPKTKADELTADSDNAENFPQTAGNKDKKDEQLSDGSSNAFEKTENS